MAPPRGVVQLQTCLSGWLALKRPHAAPSELPIWGKQAPSEWQGRQAMHCAKQAVHMAGCTVACFLALGCLGRGCGRTQGLAHACTPPALRSHAPLAAPHAPVQQLEDDATVLELKQTLLEEEGACLHRHRHRRALRTLRLLLWQCEEPSWRAPSLLTSLPEPAARPRAGIPVAQQVLCHAGQHLKDHLSLADHQLEEYTLSNEVRVENMPTRKGSGGT